MTSTYVDGDFFAADGGAIRPLRGGKNEGWNAEAPKDTLLRPAPTYCHRGRPGEARGQIYGFDDQTRGSSRVTKIDGTYVAQYRLPAAPRTGRTSAPCTSSRDRGRSRRRLSGCPATASTRRSS